MSSGEGSLLTICTEIVQAKTKHYAQFGRFLKSAKASNHRGSIEANIYLRTSEQHTLLQGIFSSWNKEKLFNKN